MKTFLASARYYQRSHPCNHQHHHPHWFLKHSIFALNEVHSCFLNPKGRSHTFVLFYFFCWTVPSKCYVFVLRETIENIKTSFCRRYRLISARLPQTPCRPLVRFLIRMYICQWKAKKKMNLAGRILRDTLRHALGSEDVFIVAVPIGFSQIHFR